MYISIPQILFKKTGEYNSRYEHNNQGKHAVPNSKACNTIDGLRLKEHF